MAESKTSPLDGLASDVSDLRLALIELADRLERLENAGRLTPTEGSGYDLSRRPFDRKAYMKEYMRKRRGGIPF